MSEAARPLPADAAGRVLLVDDSVIALEVVSGFLAEQGWFVETAASGGEALDCVPSFRPDVIVCDLNMPDMDGVEVFRRVREIDAIVPLIMLSGGDDLGAVLETVHAGVFDFVPKSNDPRVLLAAVVRALTHVQVVRENHRLSQDLLLANQDLERRVDHQTGVIREKLQQEAALQKAAELAPLRRELEIATHIQTFILPKEPRIRGLDIAAQMIPAAEVGGDYYDVQAAADGCWIGIGDVAGHGLTAGLIMLMIQSGIAALTRQSPDAAPNSILANLNGMLRDNVRQRLGRDEHATLTLLRYRCDGRVTFAGAHEEIIVCPDGGGPCRRVETPGTWMGVKSDILQHLPNSELQLQPGDLMVLYSDGIIEALQEREQYGIERLCAAVAARRKLPLQQITDEILGEVRRWGGPPADDLTLLVLRYLGVS